MIENAAVGVAIYPRVKAGICSTGRASAKDSPRDPGRWESLEIGGDTFVLGGLGWCRAMRSCAPACRSSAIDFAAGTIEFCLAQVRALELAHLRRHRDPHWWAQGSTPASLAPSPAHPRPIICRTCGGCRSTSNQRPKIRSLPTRQSRELAAVRRPRGPLREGAKGRVLGRVAAQGNANFDALIYFNRSRCSVSAAQPAQDGDVCAGWWLRLTGPNTITINGRLGHRGASISISRSTPGVGGNRPNATVDAVAALRTAINGTLNRSVSGRRGVTFRNAPEMAIDIGGMLVERAAARHGIRERSEETPALNSRPEGHQQRQGTSKPASVSSCSRPLSSSPARSR